MVKIDQAFCLAHGQVGGLAALGLCEVMLGAAAILTVAQLGVTAMTLAFIAAFFVMWPLRVRRVAKVAQVAPLVLARPQMMPFICAALMAGAVKILVHFMAGLTPFSLLVAGTGFGILVYGVLSWMFMGERITRLRALIPAMGRYRSSKPN